ncbi:MAG TPA: tRNA pseudouridine(55) synthase TruB [Pyrinomonadaceae bacterium]|nr:tRNA pseudouridine(55) synthase TruB [Pyrinomonadaceae bacterium]
MNGVLVIDKPPGITSHDVVDEVRRILRVRRVGHAGTLDPFATGVLVVLVGRATRLAQFLSGLEKEYEAAIRLGFATDTGDLTGQRVPDEANNTTGPWTKAQLEMAMQSLRGEIDQVPPMYSAKKQGGRKLYELAREGLHVERDPVRVCIHAFEPIDQSGPFLKDNLDGTFDFKARVACSSGTYIRTLAEDFGKQLGVGAHLVELRRTRVGDLPLEQANSLAQVREASAEESLGKVILLPDEALGRFPFLDLNENELQRVRNGLDIIIHEQEFTDKEAIRMRGANGHLIAVGVFDAAKKFVHPAVVLGNEES